MISLRCSQNCEWALAPLSIDHKLLTGWHLCCMMADYRECLSEDFKCGSGLCIPVDKKCDGYLDCRDHSDEDQCKGLACNLDQLR